MRADLRLTDLYKREKPTGRMLNIRIPAKLFETIARVAEQLDASKTDVVVALLNEGLARANVKR